MPNRKIIIGLVAAGLLAGGFAWLWTSRTAPAPTVAWGSVDARRVSMSFENAGRIAELRLEEGDRVKPGDLLGTLDVTALRLERNEAQAAAEAAAAEWRLAKEGYRAEDIQRQEASLAALNAQLTSAQTTEARRKALLATGAVDQQAYDDARFATKRLVGERDAAAAELTRLRAGLRPDEVAAKAAAMRKAEAAVARLDDRIGRASELRAVSPGVIRARLLEPGDMASSSTPVYEIAVTSPKWVRVWVSETQLGFVKEGAEALVTTDTTPPMKGVVGFVSPEAEFTPKSVQTQDLRTVLVYEVRLTVEDPENALKLGQPVTVDFAGVPAEGASPSTAP